MKKGGRMFKPRDEKFHVFDETTNDLKVAELLKLYLDIEYKRSLGDYDNYRHRRFDVVEVIGNKVIQRIVKLKGLELTYSSVRKYYKQHKKENFYRSEEYEKIIKTINSRLSSIRSRYKMLTEFIPISYKPALVQEDSNYRTENIIATIETLMSNLSFDYIDEDTYEIEDDFLKLAWLSKSKSIKFEQLFENNESIKFEKVVDRYYELDSNGNETGAYFYYIKI